MDTNVIVAVVLFCAVGLTLLLNGLIIVIFAKRRRVRTPAVIASNVLYLYLAVIDVIGALFWSLPAAVSAILKQELWSYDCYIRLRVRVLCSTVNAFILMILMGERLLRILRPKKRDQIHILKSAVLVVIIITVASYLIADSPSFDDLFYSYSYMPDFFQCEYTTQYGATYFVFTSMVYFGLPFVLIAVAHVAILFKVCHLMRMRGPRGYVVLNRRSEHSGNGYIVRLKTQINLLRDVATKAENPEDKLQQNYADTGYFDADADVLDSSDEEFEENQMQQSSENNDEPVYLSLADMKLVHAYAAISYVYLALWIPYYIRMVMYTFDGTSLGDVFVLVAVCLIHFGGAIKMPFYLFSDNFRGALMKTLCCRS